MTPIEVIERFYALPRNTAAERGELMGILDEDIHYVGVYKESAKGRLAIERLFTKYEGSGQTDVKFKINNIAANGNTVLVDMVDTFTINGKSIDVVFSNVFKVRGDKIVYWQEHYDLTNYEAAFGKRIPATERA